MEKRIIYLEKKAWASEERRMPGLIKREIFFKHEISGGLR